VSLALRKVWPLAAATVAGGLAFDGLGHLLHVPFLSTGMASAGLLTLWWVNRPRKRPGGPAPTDCAGWLARLERMQQQFLAIEHGEDAAEAHADDPSARRRAAELQALRAQLARPGLHLAVVGAVPKQETWRQQFVTALNGGASFVVHWSHPLPRATNHWVWPEPFRSSDVLVFCLRPPLMAADLRWLEALPEDQPRLLLLDLSSGLDPETAVADVAAQLGPEVPVEAFCYSTGSELKAGLKPWVQRWSSQQQSLQQQRQIRCLRHLHDSWQGELESLRRVRFQELQQRTQWLVAAGCVAAPVPSLDLLVLAIANGLMVKDMARLWDCPWTAEQLRTTAVELGRACLALGVVEWTSQALAGAVKWHGATWLIGSAVQALSAAYLTRVVGRAMADTLALSAGVTEPDLERIRREAPLLVAKAAESERLDWQSFLQQGRQWLTKTNGAETSAATAG